MITQEQASAWREGALLYHEASGFSGLTLTEWEQLPAEKKAVLVLASREFRRKLLAELVAALAAPASAVSGGDPIEALRHEELATIVMARARARREARS